MAEPVDESAFWLPSDFLTDDDLFFMAKEVSDHDNNGGSESKRSTPPVILPPPHNNGGPRLFRSSSALNSPGESVVSSTETDSNDDRDEFIAELTRHLSHSNIRERPAKLHHTHEKPWAAMATSPQSTLSGFRRFPGNGIPPAPAFDSGNDEAWELIYAAAQRVARMRLNHQATRGLLAAPRHSSSAPMEVRTPPVCYNAPQNNNNQFQRCAVHGTALGLPQSAWPPLRPQPQMRHHACAGVGGCAAATATAGSGMRAVFLGGPGPANGIKRQSTGTGVFLPRRVGNTITEPRKKQQGCSTVLLPARVVQALNLNIDEMNGHGHGHAQPCFAPNHDILVARRNAAMAQQRRSLRAEGPISHHEVPLLPQEWTY